MTNTAEIIPFPTLRRPDLARHDVSAAVDDATAAPAVADYRLAQSLDDQRGALLAWQASLNALTTNLRSLSANLRVLQERLDQPKDASAKSL